MSSNQFDRKMTTMSYADRLSQAWSEHAQNPEATLRSIATQFAAIESAEQVALTANLVAHLCGEHLGRCDQGLEMLSKLREHPRLEKNADADAALTRNEATLRLAQGDEETLIGLDLADQVRVLAAAASACLRIAPDRAAEFFRRAQREAATFTDDQHPVIRALAVAANNLAVSLEEKTELAPNETQLMLEAAHAARQFWSRAGTWLHVERAEYRLAKSHLRAGLTSQARVHADCCVSMCLKNSAGAVDLFFGFEALACCAKSTGENAALESALRQMKTYYGQMSQDDQSWCRETWKTWEPLCPSP